MPPDMNQCSGREIKFALHNQEVWPKFQEIKAQSLLKHMLKLKNAKYLMLSYRKWCSGQFAEAVDPYNKRKIIEYSKICKCIL